VGIYGRWIYRSHEAIKFCRISRGSLSELKNHRTSSFDFEYFKEITYHEGFEKIGRAKISLNDFIASNKLKKKES
jgi:hypothetical protein